jgi:DNA-binding beta-propeller fold protein YncE
MLCLAAMGGWLASVSRAVGLEDTASPLTNPLGTGSEATFGEGEVQQAGVEALHASPEAVAARAASQTLYKGESGSQAAATIRAMFPSFVARQDGGPPSLEAGDRSLGYTGANVERVEAGTGAVGVVQSLAPIAMPSSSGGWRAVDLAVHGVGGSFEAKNPVVPVRIPKHLAEGVQIPGLGLSLTPVDAQGVPLGGSEGVAEGTTVLFANTQTDSDTLLKPATFGVDASAVLRSPESPEVLYYKVGMPRGAHLSASPEGQVVSVVEEGTTVATLRPPVATDAAGTTVPLTESVSGDTVVVSVKHRGGAFQYPILVDPEFWQAWSNVVPGNWSFHEWIGYNYEIAGAELRARHAAGSFAQNDFGIWNEQTKGYTKISQVYVKDELYPWSAPLGQRDTPSWLHAYIEIFKPKVEGEYEGKTEAVTTLSGSPYASEATVCVVACSPEHATENNAALFAITTNEAGSTSEEFYAHASQVSTEINQEHGEHSKLKYNTSLSEVEGTDNVLYGSGAYLGHGGELEYMAEDGGLGVAEVAFEVKRGSTWEKAGEVNYQTKSSCTGLQCAASEHKGIDYNDLSHAGADPLPEPEAQIRLSARSQMPYSSSSEHGEGEVTLKTDYKAPHGITVSGLPMEGSELTLGEGPAQLVAEATDGEGSTPSAGIRSIRLSVDGREVGTGGGECASGPCTGAARWTLKGAELGSGAHQLAVVAEDNAGNTEHASYTLNVYAASPVAAGPGSVNPESGDFAMEATDVDMSGGLGSLAISRHYDSRNLTEGEEGPFGPQWSAGLGSLASLEVLPDNSVMVVGPEGLTHFEENGGKFEPPTGDSNLGLSYVANYESSGKPAYLFTNTTQDTTTVFELPEHAESWMPVVSKGPTATNTTTDEYQTVKTSSGKWMIQPLLELAPHPNIGCAKGHWHAGCRALEFVYYESKTASGTEKETEWGGLEHQLHEVIAVAWNPAKKEITKTTVASYLFDSRGWLRAEWNPSISPALKTYYGYDAEGHIVAVTPPGQQPWLMHYGTTPLDTTPGRLLSIGRLGVKATGVSTPLKSSAAPTLSTSSPVVGTTLSVTEGTWSGSPGALYSYQWEGCSGSVCTVIPGAVNATYTPRPRDAGYALKARVTAENGSGAVTVPTAVSKLLRMPTPTYSTVFGTSGSESEKLKENKGVAVDSSGNIWVADEAANRIEKFSPSETPLVSYAPDSMLSPSDVAISPVTGNVYALNRGRDRVDEISPSSGTLITSFGGEGTGVGNLKSPSRLAVDSHGDVWVTDTGNKRVEEFTAGGLPLMSVGGGSYYQPSFASPVGIAECAGDIFVSDQEEEQVYEVSLEGALIRAIGVAAKAGSGPGEFWHPAGLACDRASSDLYVADKGNNRVQEVNMSGVFLEPSARPESAAASSRNLRALRLGHPGSSTSQTPATNASRSGRRTIRRTTRSRRRLRLQKTLSRRLSTTSRHQARNYRP